MINQCVVALLAVLLCCCQNFSLCSSGKKEGSKESIIIFHYLQNKAEESGDETITLYIRGTDRQIRGLQWLEKVMIIFEKKALLTLKNSKVEDRQARFIKPDLTLVYAIREDTEPGTGNILVFERSLRNRRILKITPFFYKYLTNFVEIPLKLCFSSDGNTLIITSSGVKSTEAGGCLYNGGLIICSLNPSGAKSGQKDPGYIVDNSFGLSPDGRFIALSRGTEILILNAEDGALLKTINPGCSYKFSNFRHTQSSCWSADFRSLIVAIHDKSNNGIVLKVNIDDSSIEEIYRQPNAETNPKPSAKINKNSLIEMLNYKWWEPELYADKHGILITTDNSLLYKGNEETDFREVSTGCKTNRLANGRISPDGRKILALGQKGHDAFLFVIDLSGKNNVKEKLGIINFRLEEYQAGWVDPLKNTLLYSRGSNHFRWKALLEVME